MELVTKIALKKLLHNTSLMLYPDTSDYSNFWMDYAVKVLSSVIVGMSIDNDAFAEIEEFFEMLPKSFIDRCNFNFDWEDETGMYPVEKVIEKE